ncbi:MAG: acyltransferase family protein, partial [Pseudomonadota bacterium]
FVISGFLITLQILKEIGERRFSIAEFYRRRIKRIAPAMFVVLAATLLVSQFLLRPEDAEGTARSAFWSILSLANVHFWLSEDASYFAASSDELPLLHFWSLGVEEQFYLFWPIILALFATRIRSRGFAVTVLGVAIASFAFAQAYYDTDPSFVYYMLPARAGELLTGAVVAWYVSNRTEARLSNRVNQAIATIGLALIIGSLYLLSDDDVFPGVLAVPATVGSAALIFSGWIGSTWVSAVLVLRPMIWVGLLSYSAYLWHWPILAFLRYGQVEMSPALAVLVFGATFALAWLSYRFVETPFRKSHRGIWAVLIRQYVAPAMLLGVVAATSMKTDGWMFHSLSPEYVAKLEGTRHSLTPAYRLDYVCQSQLATPADLGNPNCIRGAVTEAQPRVLLWGDSNAAHYIGMLGEFGEDAGFAFRNIQVGSCAPLHTDPALMVSARRLSDCRASNRLIWSFVSDFDVVIISANWTSYQNGYLDAFEKTVAALNETGVNVILLGKAPVIARYDRLCAEKSLSFPGMQCDLAPTPLPATVQAANLRLREFAERNPLVEYFDANDYLCPGDLCPLRDASGTVMYYDASHLTADASIQLGRQIVAGSGVPSVFAGLSDRAGEKSARPAKPGTDLGRKRAD